MIHSRTVVEFSTDSSDVLYPSVGGGGVLPNWPTIITKNKKVPREYCCQISSIMAAFWPTFLQIWRSWGRDPLHASQSARTWLMEIAVIGCCPNHKCIWFAMLFVYLTSYFAGEFL